MTTHAWTPHEQRELTHIEMPMFMRITVPGQQRSDAGLLDLLDLLSPMKGEPAQVTAPPAPPKPNAERFPALAALGFVFPEAVDLGPVTRPPCACPTCGRTVERVLC